MFICSSSCGVVREHCATLDIKWNCIMSRKLTTEEFIEKSKKIHGDKYDYSKVAYNGNKAKITIICPIHGEFLKTPNDHLNGYGCPKCGMENKWPPNRLSKEDFINRAKKIHGDKYDYSKVEYKNCYTPTTIICPIHGEFQQKPINHLDGCGCPKCGGRQKLTKEQFVERSRKIHGDKYDYSLVEYKSTKQKVKIICPKHGVFEQMPKLHMKGNGCPKCNYSSLEREVDMVLTENSFFYIPQCGCKTFKWIGLQSLDFYIPKYNVAIECQGEQHYKPTTFSTDKLKESRQKHLEIIQERDQRKARLCKENGVKLLYYTHCEKVEESETIFKDKAKLLQAIVSSNISSS